MRNRLTLEEFINKALIKHGKKFLVEILSLRREKLTIE
jgi:hypothetical protein